MTEFKYENYPAYMNLKNKYDESRNEIIGTGEWFLSEDYIDNACAAGIDEDSDEEDLAELENFRSEQRQQRDKVNDPDNLTYDEAVEVIYHYAGGYATSDTELVDDTEELYKKMKEMEDELDEVKHAIDVLDSYGFRPNAIEQSRLSISTYLKYDMKDFKSIRDQFEGEIDFDYYDDLSEDELADMNQFEIRISDHDVGGRFDYDTMTEIRYSDSHGELDLDAFKYLRPKEPEKEPEKVDLNLTQQYLQSQGLDR